MKKKTDEADEVLMPMEPVKSFTARPAQGSVPAYYNRGGIICWDVAEAWGLNYNKGSALKYLCRAGHKDDEIADLRKAISHLEREIYLLTKGGVK